MTTEGLSDAKQTLLRALDAISAIEEETGANVKCIAVVYSVYYDEDGVIHDKGGWNHSTAPAWLVSAMLRHGADAIEDSVIGETDEVQDD